MANRAYNINPSGRANRKNAALDVGQQILLRGGIGVGFIFFQGPGLLGGIDEAEIGDALVALLGGYAFDGLILGLLVGRGLFIFGFHFLQLLLLLPRGRAGDAQLPGQFAVIGLQLLNLFSKAGNVLIVSAQPGKFEGGVSCGGIGGLGQLRLQIGYLLLSFAPLGDGGAFLPVCRKQKNFADDQQNQADAWNQVF